MAADYEVHKDGGVTGGAAEDAEFMASSAKRIGNVGDASGIDPGNDKGRVVFDLL